MKRIHKVLIGVGVVFVGIVVAASISGSPAPDAPAAGPDREWCKETDGGGSFLLLVNSAAAHDFTVCGGDLVVDTDLDKVLGQPGWDRRCLTSNDDVARLNAAVAVYSSKARADLAAAKSYCSAQGWSNS